MARESLHFVKDILKMIDLVDASIKGKSFVDFQKDQVFRLGMERAVEIISEASRHIPDHFKAMRAEVPWQRIKGIGNVLRHEYHGLSDNIIWKALTDELPRLQVAVKAIQDEMNAV